MNELDRHPLGHYPKYPEVTWDLAEERYLQGRITRLWASCLSCRWHIDYDVLDTPERCLVAETVAVLAHRYSCDRELQFRYTSSLAVQRWRIRRGHPSRTFKVRKKLPKPLAGITVLRTFGPGDTEVSQ